MHSLSFASGIHVTRKSVKWEVCEQWCQSIIFLELGRGFKKVNLSLFEMKVRRKFGCLD